MNDDLPTPPPPISVYTPEERRALKERFFKGDVKMPVSPQKRKHNKKRKRR